MVTRRKKQRRNKIRRKFIRCCMKLSYSKTIEIFMFAMALSCMENTRK